MKNYRTEKDCYILALCTGKRVLDVGCVNHNFEATRLPDWRHKQISQVSASLVGLDYEKGVVEELNREGWNIVAADAQDFDIRDRFPDGFDVIVASEIIEHLVNPGGFLKSLARHLAPGGKVVITTPHAYGFAFFLEVLMWGEEHINDDHTMTFSRKNITRLFRKSGLVVDEFHWLIQDTSKMLAIHATVMSRLVAKLFFVLQCIAAFVRPAYSKEMIVVGRAVLTGLPEKTLPSRAP